VQTGSTRRIWVIVIVLIIGTIVVVGRLFQFQVIMAAELEAEGQDIRWDQQNTVPDRGLILDKSGNVLAVPGRDYQLGASPPWFTKAEAENMATELAPILQMKRTEILKRLLAQEQYMPLSDSEFAGRLPSHTIELIRELDHPGLVLDPVPRRMYPQGELMCDILGYVDYDNVGGSGLESFYDDALSGESISLGRPLTPLYPRTSVSTREGADLVLTIDRTVQRTVERHLEEAIDFYGATGGTIIAMNPKTGAILASANWPCFSPYDYRFENPELIVDEAVSSAYEPGSVMKLVNMAIGLETGVVSPSSTYADTGTFLYGGAPIYNADRSGYGTVNMTQVLQWSLNTASSWIATLNSPDTFYDYMQNFGFGRTTGIDVANEAEGTLSVPGDPLWSQSNHAVNAFGQGMAVTPLQMISSVSAIANGGERMWPYVVQEQRTVERTYIHEPQIKSIPISKETANQVTAMAVVSAGLGEVEGYTVAGKSGTAQIPEGGIYHPTDTIHSYIGWLPADDPQLLILVKLDRVTAVEWGGESAGPTFSALAQDLVVLLGIPPDEVRLNGQQAAINAQP
jgi:cell division protein FtsI/penicillin-binding protein 2